MEAHRPIRDQVGAAEEKLAEDLVAAGYDVMNEVRCNAPLDEAVYEPIRAGFVDHFAGL